MKEKTIVVHVRKADWSSTWPYFKSDMKDYVVLNVPADTPLDDLPEEVLERVAEHLDAIDEVDWDDVVVTENTIEAILKAGESVIFRTFDFSELTEENITHLYMNAVGRRNPERARDIEYVTITNFDKLVNPPHDGFSSVWTESEDGKKSSDTLNLDYYDRSRENIDK